MPIGVVICSRLLLRAKRVQFASQKFLLLAIDDVWSITVHAVGESQICCDCCVHREEFQFSRSHSVYICKAFHYTLQWETRRRHSRRRDRNGKSLSDHHNSLNLKLLLVLVKTKRRNALFWEWKNKIYFSTQGKLPGSSKFGVKLTRCSCQVSQNTSSFYHHQLSSGGHKTHHKDQLRNTLFLVVYKQLLLLLLLHH